MSYIYAVLTATQAVRINSRSLCDHIRNKIDTDADFCDSDPIPFFFEDAAYNDSGFVDRESALLDARLRAANSGVTDFVLVRLTHNLPERDFYRYPGGKRIGLYPQSARYLNTKAQCAIERVSVVPASPA